MSKTTKTNTTATTNTTTKTTAKTNATKTNEKVETLLTVTELKKFFVDNGIIPKYTDSTHYVGCGTRANVFSVNALKTKYNIYVGNDMFSVLNDKTNKIDSVEYIENGNATDKTRNNMIIATTTETLKKLLNIVHDNFSAVTIA